MEQKICIGKIVKAIGIKGEVKVIGYTDSLNRFKCLKDFFVDDNSYECEKASIRNDFVALKISGVNDPSQAEKFKDKLIYVDRENAVKLDKNHYFVVDLIGCNIIDENGKQIGTISDVEDYGASDILVFISNGKEYRAPFILDGFKTVDVESKTLVALPRFLEVIVW